MATYVRRRVFRNVAWEAEVEDQRTVRRDTLCDFDGLLAHLEEINLRGGSIPIFVIGRLKHLGIACTTTTPPAELIEAVFIAQERFMRQPIELPGRRSRRRRPVSSIEDPLLLITGRSMQTYNR